jgi:hypothetical protein
MDTDAAKELEELREQNARLERLLADAELEKDALREIARDAPIDVKPALVLGNRLEVLGTLRARDIASGTG